MDKWVAGGAHPAPALSQEPAAKKAAAGVNEKFVKLTALNSKLGLPVAQNDREMAAVTGECILFPKEFDGMWDSAKKCGHDYATRAKAQEGKRAVDGPPHAHKFASILLATIPMASPEGGAILRASADRITAPQALTPIVRRCQFKECHVDSRYRYRLQISVQDPTESLFKKVLSLISKLHEALKNPATAQEAIASLQIPKAEALMVDASGDGPLPSAAMRVMINTCKHKGAVLGEVPAPRGGIEREVQSILDEFKGILD